MITETDINAIAARIETVLRDIAVPKPSRASEYYAALTLSIVLLQEKISAEDSSLELKKAVMSEANRLHAKRAELEEAFESETSEHVGGS